MMIVEKSRELKNKININCVTFTNHVIGHYNQ
jgi:hypothetical protein